MSLSAGAAILAKPKKLDADAEQVIVEQFRRNDTEAFGLIVDAYKGRIFGFVRRMLKSDDEAEDVTQEVFLKAFNNLHRFDGRSSLRTWLFKIAHNLCIDRSRSRKRALKIGTIEHTEDEEAAQIPDDKWNPENIVMTDELVVAVSQAVESMSEKLRTVLLLHDQEDMAYEEIAAAINVPVGTVKSRLFLARDHLKKAVSRYLGEGYEIN